MKPSQTMEACCSRFTTAEGGARLAATTSVKNTLAVEYASFIATRLVYEEAYKIRGSLHKGKQRSVYVTRASRVPVVCYELNLLTDLAVAQATQYKDCDWSDELDQKEVLVCTSSVLKQILEEDILAMANLNVLILDSCHLICKDDDMKYIMKRYKEYEQDKRPRILALTYPLFASIKKESREVTTIKDKLPKIEESVKETSKDIENISSTDSDITDSKAFETNNSKDPNTSGSKDTEIDSKDITNVASEISETIDSKDTKTSGSKDTKPSDFKDTETSDFKDTKPSDSKVTETSDLIDTKPSDFKDTKASDSKDSKPSDSKDTKTSDSADTKPSDSKVTETSDLKDIKTSASEDTNTLHPEVTEIVVSNTTKNKDSVDTLITDLKENGLEEAKSIDSKDTINVDAKTLDSEAAETGSNDTKTLASNAETLVSKDSSTASKESTSTAKESATNSEDTKTDSKDTVTDSKDTITDSKDNELDPKDTETLYTIKDKPHENIVVKEEPMAVYENFDNFNMYEKLEWKIEELEKELCCQMDLAEDIDGGKRLSATLTKPKELIIEYSCHPSTDELPEPYVDLDSYMRDTVTDALQFIHEHRYDPTEIYGEDMYEEFMNIPDPTQEPKLIFKQFLYILDQLGPYAADKAAFSLLTKLEKLKIKVPYERHFLLLCLCTSVFIKIRCYADSVFSKYESDWEKIKLFCTPKVLRFAEILEKFQPPQNTDNTGNSNNSVGNSNNSVGNSNNGVGNSNNSVGNANNNSQNTKTDEMLKEIDKCDFLSLSNKIEDRVNTYEANLKDIVDENGSSKESKMREFNNMENVIRTVESKALEQSKGVLGFSRRTGRVRGRGKVHRSNAARLQQLQLNPDALCGIVFMNDALMAKIMFMVIVEMSRSRAQLSFLCTQYCAVERPADPGSEPKECQRQGKKQEEVLKKFRMHECNLLLTTAALEEGIDLPRCNLVLRWDVPASYRSYGLCRGRARAPRAVCALLACAEGADTSTLLHNVAVYRELDQIISRKCGCGIQDEPPQTEEDHADSFTLLVKPYTPDESDKDNDSKRVENNAKNETMAITTVNSDVKLNNSVNLNIPKDTKLNFDITDTKTVINNVGSNENNRIINNECGNSDLLCNKCNNKRNSDNNVCACVLSVGTHNNSDKKIDVKAETDIIASVDLSTAIALINRYCGKLPSDTFTRLAPQWWMDQVRLPARGSDTRVAYICTLRLPLNCPIKYNIVGHPMPTRVLARRMVALQACRILHKSGELDDQLMPIGKENFKAAELEASVNVHGDPGDFNDPARPGTTKRRQYYFKRTAWAFTDCQPILDASDSDIERPTDASPQPEPTDTRTVKKGVKRNMLYALVSALWCALPERYNTRGRRLHAPQHASQAIGVLMARDEPDSLQIPSFPVYTRSGEVRVSVEHVPDADVRVSPQRARLVRRFMRFVFSEVLRVRRRGMRLQNDGATHNNYYIVPTIKTTRQDGSTKIDIDWPFLELIYQHTEDKKLSELERPVPWPQDEDSNSDEKVEKNKTEKDRKVKNMRNPLLKSGDTFLFDAEKYREAVVTPWYRNQDQPQFFLVAEICGNLTPDSAFPSDTHTTFSEYYRHKYGVTLTQCDQPLLDVDHTSARLNLLTPRYVNRKGVALPVSSERTRRAKRDRLDQKQILVPELCRVHPFAAPLWFATVALPCVLYRINALLIADEIRRAVAIDVGLGIPKIDENSWPGFQWPPLDFGWSLAEVLNAESEKSDKKIDEVDSSQKEDDISEKDVTEELEGDKQEGVKEKTLNDILQEKEATDNIFEVGTWSNEMASSIPTEDYDQYMEPLPPNLSFCTSASGGTNWCDPVQKPKNHFNPTKEYSMADSDCSYMSSDFDTDDSDLNSEVSEDDTDNSYFCGSKNSNAAMGVRIEYKTAHEAEAVDVERCKKTNPAPQPDEEDDAIDRRLHDEFIMSGTAPEEYVEKFHKSVVEHKKEIEKGYLIHQDKPIVDILPDPPKEYQEKILKIDDNTTLPPETKDLIEQIFPYDNTDIKLYKNGQITLESIEKSKRVLLAVLKKSLPPDEIKKMNCYSMVDVDIDSPNYVNEKVVNIGFDTKESYRERMNKWVDSKEFKPYYQDYKSQKFDFDQQPVLEGHPGPSPSVILQALTMSNANDGINLERLETIGDSFLKFAITAYLYCAHPTVHEGKLSHMRSKQVSNLNLYRLGRNKRLGARMIASKFEPHDNWLPPCHRPPATLQHRGAAETQEQTSHVETPLDSSGCFIPYNLITQHSIPDKSIADCVEALIGAYLLECGPRGALLFMSWLGIRVLPRHDLPLPDGHPYVTAFDKKHLYKEKPPPPPQKSEHINSSDSDSDPSDDDEEPWQPQQDLFPDDDWTWPGRPVGSLRPYKDDNGRWIQPIFGELKAPPSPLLRYIADPEGELDQMLSGYDALERTLQYRFKDRSLLLQALTHASHQQNRLTDCYQRLEFLGDAILDYLITRHLYEDPRRHSPGALTDLRSALVNNTIFATLAARHGFHKYFRHMSPGLNDVLTKYVRIQEENGHSISEEHYLIQEDEMEQAEDVEVPKALGDLFESVAGAIFLDSGMSLGAVWRSYVTLMGAELEAFSAAAPKSPVRELLEAEPDTAKFGKPERLADGRRVRVCVEVFGRGAFKGVGRNYRIAKGTAARCALRHLKAHRVR